LARGVEAATTKAERSIEAQLTQQGGEKLVQYSKKKKTRRGQKGEEEGQGSEGHELNLVNGLIK